MANTTLKGYTANLITAAVEAVVANVKAESKTQGFVDIATSKKFPVYAFTAPKKNDQGEVPPIVYTGGKIKHETFWLALKSGVAETLLPHRRKYAIYDSFSKYKAATYTPSAWDKLTTREAAAEKKAFTEARTQINGRIAKIREKLEKAYNEGNSESNSETPEVRFGKSLFTMSEKIGKMEATSPRLLEAKKHIDAAIAALKVSD